MTEETKTPSTAGKDSSEYEITGRVLKAADDAETIGKQAVAIGAACAASGALFPPALVAAPFIAGAGVISIAFAHIARIVSSIVYTGSRTKVKLAQGQPIADEAAKLREQVEALAKATGEVKAQLEGVINKGKALKPAPVPAPVVGQ